MRRALVIALLGATAFAAAPAFTDLMPVVPSARRSTGGVLLPRGPIDSFFGYGGFNGGPMPLSEQIEYRTPANSWLTTTPGLAGRERHALGYDPVHDYLVIAGGANGLTVFDTVLLIKGGTGTTPALPATRPSARIDSLLAWIPEWGKFLYFGGRTSVFSNSHVNDMWSLDVADGGVTWSNLGGAGLPAARGAMCWGRDPNSGKLIVFGGEGSSNLADTWTFQPDAGTWSQLTVSGTVPSARGFAACAWDATLNQLVLYGGQTSTQVGGLFTFNPATNVWTSWDAGTPNPGPLSDSAAAFSPTLGGTIFFGGQTASSTYTNRTWLLTFGNMNSAPNVDAGPDQTVGEAVMVQLSGAVVDPDADPVSWSWAQTAGPAVTLSDAGAINPTFLSPRVVSTTVLTFSLTGNDGTLAATDFVNVTVQNNINEAPVANAGADQTVDAGTLVTLMGTAMDPNGDAIVSVSWSQVSGPAVTLLPPNALTTTFIAPLSTMQSTLTFALVVNDATLASVADQVTVTVLAFDAGIDAGIDAGVDAGIDAGMNAGIDAGVDAGIDAGVDAGLEDGGADAGTGDDAGSSGDAGSGDDAGAPDASVADAGGEDAGSRDAGVDAGDEDAGVVAHKYELGVGCGCSETPFSAMWLLGLIALARSRCRDRG